PGPLDGHERRDARRVNVARTLRVRVSSRPAHGACGLHSGAESMDNGQPTRVRYGVMGYLCSLAFILYIDRICIGQAGTAMKAELGLSNQQWGFVGVAFQIAYAIFEPMTGHWGDRFGSRRVLIRIVLWWSAFTALTGCVLHFSWEPVSGVVVTG